MNTWVRDIETSAVELDQVDEVQLPHGNEEDAGIKERRSSHVGDVLVQKHNVGGE